MCQRFEARNVEVGDVERGNVPQNTGMRQPLAARWLPRRCLGGTRLQGYSCKLAVSKENLSSQDADRFSENEASTLFLQGGGCHWL